MNAFAHTRPRAFEDPPPINRWLRFSPPVQALYDQEYGAQRVRDVRAAIIFGMILYNAYNLTSIVLLPDFVVTSVILRVAVVTPTTMAIFWIIGRISLRSAERLIAAGVLASFPVPLWLFWVSRDPLSLFTVGEFAMTFIFANMILFLRFQHAVAFTVSAVVMALLAIATKPGLEAPLALAFALQICTASSFSLYANYRHERRRCRDFIRALRAKIDASNARADSEAYRGLSLTDPLTRLPNRRHLAERLETWLAERRSVGLMMIDIDHFKLYNDTLGHLAGDRCLQLVAGTLSQITAETDGAFCARYGGEEFTVILSNADEATAGRLAHALLRAVDGLNAPHTGRCDGVGNVTVSIGLAQSESGTHCAPEGLLTAADRALYAAKVQGRNRIAVWTEQIPAAARTGERAGQIPDWRKPFLLS